MGHMLDWTRIEDRSFHSQWWGLFWQLPFKSNGLMLFHPPATAPTPCTLIHLAVPLCHSLVYLPTSLSFYSPASPLAYESEWPWPPRPLPQQSQVLWPPEQKIRIWLVLSGYPSCVFNMLLLNKSPLHILVQVNWMPGQWSVKRQWSLGTELVVEWIVRAGLSVP